MARPPCEKVERIVVAKAQHRLTAFCAGGAVREAAVALGRESLGPKFLRGDMKTPEGEYRVAGPARESRFHRFIPIDYPSREDAEGARREGRLSDADFRRIVEAHDRGEIPPADTPLGGDLGFHGEGERWAGASPDLDWTYGCIGLSDDDIDFLAERLRVGVPVEIVP